MPELNSNFFTARTSKPLLNIYSDRSLSKRAKISSRALSIPLKATRGSCFSAILVQAVIFLSSWSYLLSRLSCTSPSIVSLNYSYIYSFESLSSSQPSSLVGAKSSFFRTTYLGRILFMMFFPFPCLFLLPDTLVLSFCSFCSSLFWWFSPQSSHSSKQWREWFFFARLSPWWYSSTHCQGGGFFPEINAPIDFLLNHCQLYHAICYSSWGFNLDSQTYK